MGEMGEEGYPRGSPRSPTSRVIAEIGNPNHTADYADLLGMDRVSPLDLGMNGEAPLESPGPPTSHEIGRQGLTAVKIANGNWRLAIGQRTTR
jgi:hypothetical protein